MNSMNPMPPIGPGANQFAAFQPVPQAWNPNAGNPNAWNPNAWNPAGWSPSPWNQGPWAQAPWNQGTWNAPVNPWAIIQNALAQAFAMLAGAQMQASAFQAQGNWAFPGYAHSQPTGGGWFNTATFLGVPNAAPGSPQQFPANFQAGQQPAQQFNPQSPNPFPVAIEPNERSSRRGANGVGREAA